MTFSPTDLEHPIVQAPLAGGASTVALAAAVADAGGLGFLAAGYRAPEAVRADVAALRRAHRRPVRRGHLRASGGARRRPQVAAYAAALEADAARAGVALGEPRHDDDGWEAKLDLVAQERVPVVSFAFGCPLPPSSTACAPPAPRSG